MVQATGEYKIIVNRASKTIDMLVRGTFTPEQAKSFHQDYVSKVASINAEDFTLKVDCLDMNLITQDMIPALQVSMEMYKKSGFKKVEVLIKKSTILKMQINRVAKMVGLTNLEVVES